MGKTRALHVHEVLHYAFLYISLPSLHEWLGTWKCLISCFVEDVNGTTMTFSFLFLNVDTVFKNSTPEKSTNIWWIERDRISAIKFEAARIHFLIIWRFRSRRRCCCLSSLVYGDVALLRWPEMANIFPLIIHQKTLCGSHRWALLLRVSFCQVELSGSGFKRRSRG